MCLCIRSQAATERTSSSYSFLNNLFQHWTPALLFIELLQPALLPHPATIWCRGVTTTQPPVSAGYNYPWHWSKQNCYWELQLCPPRYTEECLGPSPGMGDMGPAWWELCTGQGSAPLDKAAVKERSILSGGCTGECQDLHRDNTLKTM